MKSKCFEQYRAQLNLSKSLPNELTIKIATTAEEYIEGYKVIYDCYIEKGYAKENVHTMRATPYHLLPSTTMILVYWKEKVIGTCSLIRDNPLGLPLEAIFSLDHFRKEHKTFCEVSSLAIKKEFRGQKGEVLFPLIRYIWNYSLDYFGIDYFVTAVNPSMSELYESILYFEPLIQNNVVEEYDFANNNPAVGLSVDVKNSYKLFDEKYGDAPFHKNMSLFLQQKSIPNNQYPVRKYFSHIDSPANPEWIELFNKIIPQLEDDKVRNIIANAFGYRTENEMQVSLNHNHNRNRIPVTFDLLNFKDSRIIDISIGGLKVVSKQEFSMNTPVLLRLQVSPDQSLSVIAQPVWKNDQYVYGFQIIEESTKWNKVIHEIYSAIYTDIAKAG